MFRTIREAAIIFLVSTIHPSIWSRAAWNGFSGCMLPSINPTTEKKKLTNQKTAAILSLSPFCCLFHIYCFQGRKSSYLHLNFSFLCPLLLLSFASNVYRACRHCCPDFFGRFHFPVCLLFFHFLFCCCCAVIVSSITLSLELNNCMKRNCFKCMNFTIYNLQFYCKFTRCICCILIQTFAKLVTHATWEIKTTKC